MAMAISGDVGAADAAQRDVAGPADDRAVLIAVVVPTDAIGEALYCLQQNRLVSILTM